ncbi:MAG TPA: dihydrodipicolinate synthase family protein [Candidatus Hydrogenedentes bacterium]|nr:dihydrodipicolinate synthase family protein [Candidatus Hydrogenedentota bacterium]
MSVPEFIRGNIAPVFTAFKENGALDDDGQRNLLDFLLDTGHISAHFVRSGLGQMYTFSYEDVQQIAQTACRHMAGKAPVLMGCSGVWDRNRDSGKRPDPRTYLEQGIELSKFAEDMGASGVVHTIPEAILPTEGQTVEAVFVRYFESVCAAVSIPVLIYQPPGTDPAYKVTPRLLARLADMPGLAAIKVSNGDAYYLFRLIRATREKDFAFIVGVETAYYAALYAGCRAVIGQGAAINPQVMTAVQERFEKGDREGALAAQDSVNLLVEQCSSPAAFLKRYATEKGHPVGSYARKMTDNPYIANPDPITDDAYITFKRILEIELAKYA